VGEKEEFLKTL